MYGLVNGIYVINGVDFVCIFVKNLCIVGSSYYDIGFYVNLLM